MARFASATKWIVCLLLFVGVYYARIGWYALNSSTGSQVRLRIERRTVSNPVVSSSSLERGRMIQRPKRQPQYVSIGFRKNQTYLTTGSIALEAPMFQLAHQSFYAVIEQSRRYHSEDSDIRRKMRLCELAWQGKRPIKSPSEICDWRTVEHINDACLYAAMGFVAAKCNDPLAAGHYWLHAGGGQMSSQDGQPADHSRDMDRFVHLPMYALYMQLPYPELRLSGSQVTKYDVSGTNNTGSTDPYAEISTLLQGLMLMLQGENDKGVAKLAQQAQSNPFMRDWLVSLTKRRFMVTPEEVHIYFPDSRRAADYHLDILETVHVKPLYANGNTNLSTMLLISNKGSEASSDDTQSSTSACPISADIREDRRSGIHLSGKPRTHAFGERITLVAGLGYSTGYPELSDGYFRITHHIPYSWMSTRLSPVPADSKAPLRDDRGRTRIPPVANRCELLLSWQTSASDPITTSVRVPNDVYPVSLEPVGSDTGLPYVTSRKWYETEVSFVMLGSTSSASQSQYDLESGAIFCYEPWYIILRRMGTIVFWGFSLCVFPAALAQWALWTIRRKEGYLHVATLAYRLYWGVGTLFLATFFISAVICRMDVRYYGGPEWMDVAVPWFWGFCVVLASLYCWHLMRVHCEQHIERRPCLASSWLCFVQLIVIGFLCSYPLHQLQLYKVGADSLLVLVIALAISFALSASALRMAMGTERFSFLAVFLITFWGIVVLKSYTGQPSLAPVPLTGADESLAVIWFVLGASGCFMLAWLLPFLARRIDFSHIVPPIPHGTLKHIYSRYKLLILSMVWGSLATMLVTGIQAYTALVSITGH